MQQWCRVCGEAAAGFHFGAFTCEGCKSFFGRSCNSSVSSLAECKSGGRCVITRKNRTACKSCRLRQCIRAGMSKSGSRYGRRSNWFKIHCLLQDQPGSSSCPTTSVATLSTASPSNGGSSLPLANEPFTILTSNSDSSLTITKKEIKYDPDQGHPVLNHASSRLSVQDGDHELESPMEETVTITRKSTSRLKLDIANFTNEQQSRLFQHQVQQVGARNEQESQFPSGSPSPNFFLPSHLQNSALQLHLLAQASIFPGMNPLVPLQLHKFSQNMLSIPYSSSEEQDSGIIAAAESSKESEQIHRLPSVASSATKSFLEYFNELPNEEAKCELLKTVEYYRQHFSKFEFSQNDISKNSDGTTLPPSPVISTFSENLNVRHFTAAATALSALASSAALSPTSAATSPLGIAKAGREEQLEPIDLSLRRNSEEIIDVTNVYLSPRRESLDDIVKPLESRECLETQEVSSDEAHNVSNVHDNRGSVNETEGSLYVEIHDSRNISTASSSDTLSKNQSVLKNDLNHNVVDRIDFRPHNTDSPHPGTVDTRSSESNYSIVTSTPSIVDHSSRNSAKKISRYGAGYLEGTRCSSHDETKCEVYFTPIVPCSPDREIDCTKITRTNVMPQTDKFDRRQHKFGLGNSSVMSGQIKMTSETFSSNPLAESVKKSTQGHSGTQSSTRCVSPGDHPVMECSVTVEQVYQDSPTSSLSSGVYKLSSHQENLVA